MKLKIFGKEAHFDQLAIAVIDPVPFMREFGERWEKDMANCKTQVFGGLIRDTSIGLFYNYGQPPGTFDFKELELLTLVKGVNWHEVRGDPEPFSPLALYAPRLYRIANRFGLLGTCFLSHLGIHSTEEEAGEWQKTFLDMGIRLAQENWSTEHTNPVIAGRRWYHDVIFDSRDALGFDMKITVRHDKKGAGYVDPRNA